MSRLRELAKSIVEDLVRDFRDDPSMDVGEAASDMVFERVSDTITSDSDAYAVIQEIDLNTSPDGDTLFRAIQKAAENVVREHVEFLVEYDDRFKTVEAPTP